MPSNWENVRLILERCIMSGSAFMWQSRQGSSCQHFLTKQFPTLLRNWLELIGNVSKVFENVMWLTFSDLGCVGLKLDPFCMITFAPAYRRVHWFSVHCSTN